MINQILNLNIKLKFKNSESGQSMLFMIMVLTGIIAMMSVTVGMLIVFGLRHSIDAQASGDAIFASDTGIECAITKEFGDISRVIDLCVEESSSVITGRLKNGASFRAERTTQGDIIIWTSVGFDKAQRTIRALMIRFREVR